MLMFSYTRLGFVLFGIVDSPRWMICRSKICEKKPFIERLNKAKRIGKMEIWQIKNLEIQHN